MDVLLLVVDSLRAHPFADGAVAATPFLDSLAARARCFTRAYATDCWTLPSHASMFTGAMPSQHGAHFQSMKYRGAAPTIAERLTAAGYTTELVTRNFVLDGSIAGIRRGFSHCRRVVARRGCLDPAALFLAVCKPRVRRHLNDTGFFPGGAAASGEFLRRFVAALQPADQRLLEHVVRRLRHNRRRGQRTFLFANLYDVHAPYPPRVDSLLHAWDTPAHAVANVCVPWALSRLGQHRYLHDNFSLGEPIRRMLQRRYRAAVELMDTKLCAFFVALEQARLLDDMAVIVTSDHGEGFGEHGLFLHDASVFETHLRVPLWVMAPGVTAGVCDDVVSTRRLADTIAGIADGEPAPGILDPDRAEHHPLAFAQHFRYPHLRSVAAAYRHNQFAAVTATVKVMRRGGAWSAFDLREDAGELAPCRLSDAGAACDLVTAPLPAGIRGRVAAEFRSLEQACR